MLKKINETVSFIQEKTKFQPEVAIILGTGLGGLVDDINVYMSLNYRIFQTFR